MPGNPKPPLAVSQSPKPGNQKLLGIDSESNQNQLFKENNRFFFTIPRQKMAKKNQLLIPRSQNRSSPTHLLDCLEHDGHMLDLITEAERFESKRVMWHPPPPQTLQDNALHAKGTRRAIKLSSEMWCRGVLQKKLSFETYPLVGTFGEVGTFTWFFMM